MKFLIDAGLPQWLVGVFANAGFDAVHADDLGISDAEDPVIADHARTLGRCIVTRDFDFANLRNYSPAEHRGIVVLTIPRDRGSLYIRLLIDKLLAYFDSGGTVDRKLLIVEADRIRVRD